MDPVLLALNPAFDFGLLPGFELFETVEHTCHVRPDGENYESFRRRFDAQADGAAHSMAAMLELIHSRYPNALQIHDCFVIDAPATEAVAVGSEAVAVGSAVHQRMQEVLRQWHKGAGFGLAVDAEPAKSWTPKPTLMPAEFIASSEAFLEACKKVDA